ncbi:cysteine hydrolase [Nocardiopsis sp. HNM0947]|uniref:Cysteine hydrolase n=1 Tax=Nocardiopsis coralli TaxID=2772213 RepID=A0ABR9P2M3_9ACTN|nr:isochorismatase family cysteine hydrolase [Nocardiopsis coralli]MBE2998079.1 cysteine hydrolase [Nocardiopsis coralli]
MRRAGPDPSPGTPERGALLVVDVQYDFASPEHVARFGEDALRRVEAAVDRVHTLVAAARSHGVPVLWARLEQDPADPWWSSRWLRGLLDADAGDLREREPCVAGTQGADWYGPGPGGGEEVVVKRRYSAFHGTGLAGSLRARGTEWVAVCGLTTDCCVDATVRDAFQEGLRTVVAGDATASYSEQRHRHTLDVLGLHAAVVTDTGTLSRAWAGARRGTQHGR